ncbi:MAG: hypothetical protein KIT31_19665, partial [Deltaproteobacteria bacterium]|nr:hypothetical protein [Deltaproteobacteria bacterium]
DAVADLPAALAALRAAVPADVELLVEPGRAIAADAGFATGHIVAARDLDDRALRISDLSRICHLRWSAVDLVHRAPHPGTGLPLLVAGPTCFEDDVLGQWTIEPTALAPGDRLTLRGVTGYALAWNHTFAGIPPADVVLV